MKTVVYEVNCDTWDIFCFFPVLAFYSFPSVQSPVIQRQQNKSDKKIKGGDVIKAFTTCCIIVTAWILIKNNFLLFPLNRLSATHLYQLQQLEPMFQHSDKKGFYTSHLQLSHLMSRPSGVRLQWHQEAPSSSEELSLSAELSSAVSW